VKIWIVILRVATLRNFAGGYYPFCGICLDYLPCQDRSIRLSRKGGIYLHDWLHSIIKENGQNLNLSQLFRISRYLKNNLHSALLSFCVGRKFYIRQKL
jgi:hypothetical protein